MPRMYREGKLGIEKVCLGGCFAEQRGKCLLAEMSGHSCLPKGQGRAVFWKEQQCQSQGVPRSGPAKVVVMIRLFTQRAPQSEALRPEIKVLVSWLSSLGALF